MVLSSDDCRSNPNKEGVAVSADAATRGGCGCGGICIFWGELTLATLESDWLELWGNYGIRLLLFAYYYYYY